jgi:hypothetical protein
MHAELDVFSYFLDSKLHFFPFSLFSFPLFLLLSKLQISLFLPFFYLSFWTAPYQTNLSRRQKEQQSPATGWLAETQNSKAGITESQTRQPQSTDQRQTRAPKEEHCKL